MNLLFDMDNVVADLIGPWLDQYNELFRDTIKVDDVTDYDLSKVARKCSRQSLFKMIEAKYFFSDLLPCSGAIEALTKLHDEKHDIFLVTKVHPCRDVYFDKLCWVRKHLPWIGDDNVIFCSRKEFIQGHMLVDDYPKNLMGFDGMSVLMDRPWNRDFDAKTNKLVRACSWDDVLKYVDVLDTFIMEEVVCEREHQEG